MKTISIEEVIIKNYRSFRDLTISFPSTAGLRMLAGENREAPRLGSNGGGKSSFWDAIEWGLHASSVQGSKISDTISWGAEQASVTLKLLINEQPNTIHRYGPPVKVELNGELVEQQKIDELIGLSKLRFLHSVIFGQDQKLFSDLPVPERGALLDDVLGLAVWQKATEAAGSKYTEIEKLLLKKKSEVMFVTGKLSSLQTNAYVEEQIARWEEDRENQLADIRNSILAWQIEQNVIVENLEKQKEEWKEKLLGQIEEKALGIENLEAELAPIKFEVENEVVNPFATQITVIERQLKYAEELRDRQTEILHQANHEHKSLLKSVEFWANDKCPVCTQPITKEKKKHELALAAKLKSELEIKITEADKMIKAAVSSIETCQNQLIELRGTTIQEQEKKKAIRKEVTRIEAQIAIIEHEAKRLMLQFDSGDNPYEKQILQLKQNENPYEKQEQTLLARINPHVAQLGVLKQERAKLETELVTQENAYKLLESQMIAAEYWKHGFKRIRLYFIQQVLATLQIEIQSAISSLGLEGWSVGLATESETKSQTIKLGVALQVKSPQATAKWEVFCGGEKQRLRLGIAMGLASLIQRASGCFWTLEVYDEPSRSLSPQGVEDLLESLRSRAETIKKQIWLTDHSTIQFSGFDAIWTAIKDENGSRIEKQLQEA